MMFRAKVTLRRNLRLSSRAGSSQFRRKRRGILTITPKESRTDGGFRVIHQTRGCCRIFNELGGKLMGTTFT